MNYCYLLMGSLLIILSCTKEKALPENLQSLDNLAYYSKDEKPQFDLVITQDISFGREDTTLIGNIYGVEVDRDGNVYVSEGSSGMLGILKFDENGNFLDKFGREGRGPGEFLSIYDYQIYEDKLYTMDGGLMKMCIFNIETGELLREINFMSEDWIASSDEDFRAVRDIYFLNENEFIFSYSDPNFYASEGERVKMEYINLAKFDIKNETVTLLELTKKYIKHFVSNDRAHYFDPFGGRGLFEVNNENEIIYAWSDSLLFEFYDSNGEYQRAIYHESDPIPLAREEALNQYGPNNKEFQDVLIRGGVPEFRNAFSRFYIDDENRIWIPTTTNETETNFLKVFDETGVILGETEWESSKQIEAVSGNYIYTNEDDLIEGEKVRKYRFELN